MIQQRKIPAEVHYNLGNTLTTQRRIYEAERSYRCAIELQEVYPEAHNNLGIVLAEQRRNSEAEASFRRAIELREAYPEAHYNLGTILVMQKRISEAEACIRRAIELKAEYPEAHYNLGIILAKQGRSSEAETAYRRSIQLRNEFPEAYNNLGNLLTAQGRASEAETALRYAVKLREAYPDAHNNLGYALAALGRMSEAEIAYRRALELKSSDQTARFNLGLLQLALGRYDEGWRNYEARLESFLPEPLVLPPFPRWQGEDIAGKSLLLLAEQGFGDSLQFVRYARLIKQCFGPSLLTVACPAALASVFETVAGIDAVEVVEKKSIKFGMHDRWCFVGSLPLFMSTLIETIPATLPYIKAQADRVERWRPRLPAHGLRVGLVWKGNPRHKNDVQRSLPSFRTLAPLWQVSGISFISLQKDENEATAGVLGCPLIHLGSGLADFGDTAAIVSQLDLVITVDTATAHLSGALGRPTWILLPAYRTDWRWFRERQDSPWYPGVVKLFRQPVPGGWEPVIEKVGTELAKIVAIE